MKIYIGADHNGYQLRSDLIKYLKRAGYKVVDEGDKQLDPQDDFPIFAQKVARAVLSDDDNDARGIMICGSGQGMCMAANRFPGIRAALGYDYESARSARHDDDSNILCLPAHLLQNDQANTIVDVWLNTPFDGATRFRRRIREMDELV